MNFWLSNYDLKLIPGSGRVDKRHWLVDLPVDVERNFPNMSKRLGEVVMAKSEVKDGLHKYGLLLSPNWPQSPYGLFQTDHPLGIGLSVGFLLFWIEDNPTMKVLLHPTLDIRAYVEDPQIVYATSR